jgi:hypothetical protein
VKNKKRTYRGLSQVKAAGIGISITFATLLLQVIICTIFIGNEYISISNINVISTVIVFISCCTGCFVAQHLVRERHIVVCFTTICLNIILLICTGIILFGGISAGIYLQILASLLATLLSLIMRKFAYKNGNKGLKRAKL